MKEFEQEKLMEVNGQDAWVIASLGVITADLPQVNDMHWLKSMLSGTYWVPIYR